MDSLNIAVALPEIVLLATACLVLVVDLFVPDERRNVTYGLTLLALLAVAVAVAFRWREATSSLHSVACTSPIRWAMS